MSSKGLYINDTSKICKNNKKRPQISAKEDPILHHKHIGSYG